MLQNNNLYRRNGKKVYIKQPEFQEMNFTRELWADKETMEEIGGTYDFPMNKWEMFYKKMVYPTDGKNFYCLVYNNRDKAIGEVSFHGYDSATSVARFNIKIHSKYRRKGFGEEAVKLLLEYYFQEFGGKIIMDNIITGSGESLAKKLGFEEVRKNKNSTTMRVSKDTFLSAEKCKNTEKTNIEVLIFSNMNALDYTMPFEMFDKANQILGQDVFDVKGVAIDKNIKLSPSLDLNLDYKNPGHQNPNILIIPEADYFSSDDSKNKVIDYILSCYNECDYICAMGEGIISLAYCKELDGMLIPKGEWVKKVDVIYNGNYRVVNKNFTDNGKLMLSTNLMGNLELYLNLLKKVGGHNLEKEMEKVIGLKK